MPIVILLFFFAHLSSSMDQNSVMMKNLLSDVHPYFGRNFGTQKSNEVVSAMLKTMFNSNTTYETFQSSKVASPTFSFRRTKKQNSDTYVPILITTVESPLSTFSIYPPLFPGGCNTDGEDFRTEVSITSKNNDCVVASNAGFFDINNGECFGNIVSDGKILQNTGFQNANFGVRRDGTIVVGYLSKADVDNKENPFVNLVAGVIWLVRDGVNYVSESALVEDMTRQTTGNSFVTVQSARAAIGHDNQGRIVLVQVDGKSWERGISLPELANFMVSIGIVNGVNLDGGGSMTAVVNGSLANYPSDYCSKTKDFPFDSFCERKVTSIVCLHAPRTDAPTLSPTSEPTSAPTNQPTQSPTISPTSEPTQAPTSAPTREPTNAPSLAPTSAPTATMSPTPGIPVPCVPTNDTSSSESWYRPAVVFGLLANLFVFIMIAVVLFWNFYLKTRNSHDDLSLIGRGSDNNLVDHLSSQGSSDEL